MPFSTPNYVIAALGGRGWGGGLIWQFHFKWLYLACYLPVGNVIYIPVRAGLREEIDRE